MNITLKPIDEGNFLDAFHLQLRDDQTQYVSHPIRSLAQAYVYRNQCQPFGIYADARMVGYVMVIYDYDVPEYDIWHMMIDAAEQGKGYGTAAMKAVLDYIATKPFGGFRARCADVPSSEYSGDAAVRIAGIPAHGECG